MNYRVFWSPNAEIHFDAILETAPDPPSIAAAARAIDVRLSTDPNDFGESRLENVRIAFTHPLGIEIEVLEDVSTIIVYEVWRTDLHRN